MEYLRLISYVENNLNTLARTYYEQIKKSDYMKTYQKLDPKKAIEREELVFLNLIDWLKSGASNDEAEKYFERVGAERFAEGFPLSEVNYALYLTKKVFWSAVAWKFEITGHMSNPELLEFITILGNYFDLGSFYITRGYFREMFDRLDASAKFSKDEIQNIFVRGAFDSDELNKSEIVWRHV